MAVLVGAGLGYRKNVVCGLRWGVGQTHFRISFFILPMMRFSRREM